MINRILPILLFFPVLLHAQTESDSIEASRPVFHTGDYSISGGVSYSHTTFPHSEETITNIVISPVYLTFISPRFAFGGRLVYTWQKMSSQFGSSSFDQMGVGPQFRYYALQTPVHAFLAFSVLAVTGSSTISGSTFQGSSLSFAALDVGADLFIAGNLSLEPYLEYRFNFSGGGSPGQTVSLGISFATFVLDK